MTEIVTHENPLIPNKKLQQMFVSMVEMRVLDEHTARLQRGGKAARRLDSIRGEEACLVSTAIELEPGDLVSDSQAGLSMELLSGVKLSSLLKQIAAITSSTKGTKVAPDVKVGLGRQLPWIDDADDRLRTAIGAAIALKTLNPTRLVVAYVRPGEISNRVWRKIFTLASKFVLPILFVALPESSNSKKKRDKAGELSSRSRSCGVPGIPVDASDAVALYRVAQESLGRARGGAGPALIECVSCRVKGRQVNAAADPIVQMRGFLLARKVCSETWLNQAGSALRRTTGAGSRRAAKSPRRA